MTALPGTRKPVIIGIGQFTNRSDDPEVIFSPMDLIEKAIERAEKDSTIKFLARKIDSLCLVNIFSQIYRDPLSELQSRIGVKPRHNAYTWIGATAPQWFVNRTAERIASGESRLALICGGEAFHSKKINVQAMGKAFDQWEVTPKEPWMAGDLRDPLTPLEVTYGLMLPIHIYPLFENALRHHEGLSIENHRKELGEYLSGCSSIAAQNDEAWFKQWKTGSEIVEISKDNRMISFPYTKSMCSIMQVDQSAALFLTDEQTAERLGVPEEKWIYLLGSGDASDVWHVSERINYYSSPSAGVAAEKAMEQAGVSIDRIDHFDLYSCFPCVPRITRNMLGMPKSDPRPLTITGSMPYFGGPGNNYSLHAICKMVEILRHDRAKTGLVHAMSWFISKHAVGIYSGTPGKGPWKIIPPETYQKELDLLKGPALVDKASGNAVVETYTVFHDKTGCPIRAVIIGRLDDNSRFISKTEMDDEIFQTMMKQEMIGVPGRVRHENGFNIFRF